MANTVSLRTPTIFVEAPQNDLEKDLPLLEKINQLYDAMSHIMMFPIEKIQKNAAKNFSEAIVKKMEEFIISKASPESLLQDSVQKALPKGTLSDLNVRYPKLRAPAFQTCIEDVLAYTITFDHFKIDSISYVTEIGKAITAFNEYAEQIQPK